MINQHPYDVGVLKNTVIQPTCIAINRAIKDGQLATLKEYSPRDHRDDGFDIRLVTDSPDIKLFFHPLLVKDNVVRPTIALDFRVFGNKVVTEDIPLVGKVVSAFGDKHTSHMEQLVYNAILMGRWLTNAESLITYNAFGCDVYANIIGRSLKNQLSLEPETTSRIYAAFQFFYWTRGLDVAEVFKNEDKKASIALTLSRRFSNSAPYFNEIVGNATAEDLATLSAFCEWIVRQEWSVRLKRFSYRDVLLLCSRMWTAQGNGTETIVSALEFPPTFLSLLYTASLYPSFYKNTLIGEVIKPYRNSQQFNSFVLQTKGLLKLAL